MSMTKKSTNENFNWSDKVKKEESSKGCRGRGVATHERVNVANKKRKLTNEN